MKSVTAIEMKEIDRKAIEDYGIPRIVLMENAGLKVYDVSLSILKGIKEKKVVLFCGKGNNGGDGFVTARHLINNGINISLYILCKEEEIKGEALTNFNILLKMNREFKEFLVLEDLKMVKKDFKDSSLIIDAIFGIGLNGEIGEPIKSLIDFLNSSGKPILSVDIPSGLNPDSGRVLSTCIGANTTVTFGLPKKGFFINEGPEKVGDLIVADIGIPIHLLK